MEAIGPIGVGTAEVESLSSYFMRLSDAHGVLPGQLVFRQLTWVEKRLLARMGEWARLLGSLRIGCNINSFGLADVWLRVLQVSTRRADLVSCTTRAWDSIFPARGFRSAILGWCPLCLAGDRKPYHRLHWMVGERRTCHRHRRPLQYVCASCRRPLPVLHERSRVTICCWCAHDLRETVEARDLDVADYDVWATGEIRSVVAAAAACETEVTWRPLAALKLVARARGFSRSAAVARHLRCSKVTVHYWWCHGTRPSLEHVLHAYYIFGFSFADHFVSPDPARLPVGIRIERQSRFRLRSRKKARQIDWSDVIGRLEEEVKRPEGKAESLIQVARQLEIARRTLRQHARLLCREITRRHRERMRREREARELALARKFRAALLAFAARGVAPKWEDLEYAVGQPGLLNSGYARRALRRAAQTL